MESINIEIGTVVVMKKGHPCGENEWTVVRLGTDIKIKCNKCERIVMMPRIDFNKKVKRVLN
jgi:Uncharacterized protein conserved in bacteria